MPRHCRQTGPQCLDHQSRAARDTVYRAERAQALYLQRHVPRVVPQRHLEHAPLCTYVEARINVHGYMPEQVAGRLHIDFPGAARRRGGLATRG